MTNPEGALDWYERKRRKGGRMSRTDLDAETLACSLRDMAGDGSIEWTCEPIQTSVLLDIADLLDTGTCQYEPDYTGFTWWDENDVEHYEEDSANEECWSASCSKCGFTMIVGDEGWFNGWDDIKVWTDEAGIEHHGILLEPVFKFCPNCGRRVVE